MNVSAAVDSSALVAVLKGEPEEGTFVEALAGCAAILGWPTILETRIWLLRWGGNWGNRWLDEWLASPFTEVVAFDRELEQLATSAYARFGKGRHRAGLNFGDCMTYAVAVRYGVPLLFKGRDFGRTDVEVHPASTIIAP